MLIPQYQVLVLKLSPINTVSLNTVFSIPQNQCYPGTPCISSITNYLKFLQKLKNLRYCAERFHYVATCNQTEIFKWQWQKQIECSAAGATFFFQISRQKFILNFSLADRKLKNLRGYYEEQFHYVVPEQKNR